MYYYYNHHIMLNGTHTKSTKQTTFNDDHEDDDDSNNSYSPDLMSIFIAQFLMKYSLHRNLENIPKSCRSLSYPIHINRLYYYTRLQKRIYFLYFYKQFQIKTDLSIYA